MKENDKSHRGNHEQMERKKKKGTGKKILSFHLRFWSNSEHQ